jgi:hypothetical protein
VLHNYFAPTCISGRRTPRPMKTLPRSAGVGEFKSSAGRAWCSPANANVNLLFHAVSGVGVVCDLQSNLKLQRTRKTRGIMSPSVVYKMPLVVHYLRTACHSSAFCLDTIVTSTLRSQECHSAISKKKYTAAGASADFLKSTSLTLPHYSINQNSFPSSKSQKLSIEPLLKGVDGSET